MAANRPRKLFVNLAVKNPKRSMEFFTRLGFSFNPQFTSDQAACMIVSEEAFVMLLSHEHFKQFTKKEICDTSRAVEGLFCISAESRTEVDALVNTAIAAGGAHASPPQDHGVMYGWSFEDLDGHTWEVMWMDPAALAPSAPKHELIAPPGEPTFITRGTVDAPRSLVFEAFTRPDYISRWMGPRALAYVSCDVDLRPGGAYRFVQRAPNGQEFRFHGTFREIAAPERIVRTFVFEGMPDHEAVETLTLEEKDGKTLITTKTVHKTIQGRDGHLAGGKMEASMGEIFARLDELLAEIRGGGKA